jgi:hypothetical protein
MTYFNCYFIHINQYSSSINKQVYLEEKQHDCICILAIIVIIVIKPT